MPRFVLQGRGSRELLEVDVEGREGELVVRSGGRELRVSGELDDRGEGVLRLPDRVATFYAVWVGDTLHLGLDGEVYRLTPVEPGCPLGARAAASGGGAAADGAVRSPMPGTVLRVLAAAGEPVAAGAPLVLLESMKMELTVTAPAAGRVREVLVDAGASVELGAVLVRLDVGSDPAVPPGNAP